MWQLALVLMAQSELVPKTEGFPETYLCVIESQGMIAQSHLANAGPPFALAENDLAYEFVVAIDEQPDGRFSINELYRDDINHPPFISIAGSSLLHAVYEGDGRIFNSSEGPGFIIFQQDRRRFYHAGLPGLGERDVALRISVGHCRRLID